MAKGTSSATDSDSRPLTIRLNTSTASSSSTSTNKRPRQPSTSSSNSAGSISELEQDLDDEFHSDLSGAGGSSDEDFNPSGGGANGGKVTKRMQRKPGQGLKLSSGSKAKYSSGGAEGEKPGGKLPSLKVTLGGSKETTTTTTTTTTTKTTKTNDLSSSIFSSERDFTFLPLKPDHATRPFYISPATGNIILENFHPLAAAATDFLIAIAEPVSRPEHIHEYKLTPHSLYAAVSVGLKTEDIIEVLNRMSKVPVPEEIKNFIRECTVSYGKVKLVLKKNKHYVESGHAETLRILLRDEVVSKARVVVDGGGGEGGGGKEGGGGGTATYGLEKDKAPRREGLIIPGTKAAGAPGTEEEGRAGEKEKEGQDKGKGKEDDPFTVIVGLEREDDMDDDEEVHAFEILESEIETVKRRCLDLDYPMMEEYDFRHDELNPDLEIDLKPTTSIRPYQEKSLGKMFGNGRARSGIIVLPCGAGKTLVGITAACTIRKSCIVLCTSGVSVMQWKQQFLQWSTIKDSSISVFTADQKEKFIGDAGIVVSTYSMVANRTKRSHDSQKMMDFLTSREWGFVLLDEVHVVPAAMFRRVVTTIKAHTKLGLTATLVREDDKIDDLNFLIGPKLYEANWMDLAQNGHIARVQCAEVWCEMTPEFYREYLREKSRKRMLLYSMNPKKFQACQYLIHYHESRGDKIIVFSDNVYALEAYAKKLGKLYIHGGTPQVERMRILQNFQHNPVVNTIFLSKVGDTSIDLPEATCLIQISSHFGSRRQEAQRLGRILRAKRRNDEGFNAFFYSLVSKDTQEIYYSSKRQGFLVDQGYAFKVITELAGIDSLPNLVYPTRDEQIELLQSVLLANESDADLGSDVKGGADDLPGTVTSNSFGGPSAAKRIAGSLGALSGGQSMAYVESNRSQNKQLAKSQNRHTLFKKRGEKKKRGQGRRDDD